MKTIFQARPYGRFIEIQSKPSFNNRDNAKALIQFRRESKPQRLQR